MLNAISKKIIKSRLYDIGVKGEKVNEYLDSVIINIDDFNDLNTMYDFIVKNYGKIIIA